MYNGIVMTKRKPALLSFQRLRIYKVGNPTDSLVTYVYKRNKNDLTIWLPHGEHFISQVVEGKNLTTDTQGQYVDFVFPETLKLEPGQYVLVTYRTGLASDEDFYRVYVRGKQYNQDYIQSAIIPE